MELRFNKKNYLPIGLDIGAHCIKLVQLQREGGAWRVTAAASDQVPASDEGDAQAECIRRLLESNEFMGRRVVSCLPATEVQYKNMRLPKMPTDELRGAVEWEASDRLQLRSDTHRLQFFEAGEVRQGDEVRSEIILMAAAAPQVQKHIELLARLNLEPVAIDAVPGALARFSAQCCANADEASVRVVVDVGYASSKVLICRNDRVLFFKLIEIGGQKFDQAVAEHLKMSEAEAAEVRRQLVQGDDRNANSETAGADGFAATRRESVEQAVLEAIRPHVTDLARELGLCLRYYSVTFRGKRPESVLFSGGEASQPYLVELLREGVGTEVGVIDGIDVEGTEALGSNPLCQWVVALGLSMRGQGSRARRSAA